MELQQLRYFQEVARTESFSNAAAELHITQSALSKSIAKLEDEIGVKLFDRYGNRIRLSQFGEVLLSYTNDAASRLDNGIAVLREMSGLEAGMVRIGVGFDVFIKHIIRDFLFAHPNATVQCFSENPRDLEKGLLSGNLDMALTTSRLAGNNLIWEPLFEDHLDVIAYEGHPLVGRESAYLRDFADDRFIITNVTHGDHSDTYTLCHFAGFEPKIIFEGSETELSHDLLSHGLGVQITPHSITEGVARYMAGSDEASAQFAALVPRIPLADNFSRKTIGLITAEGHYFSAAAQEMIDRIRDFFHAL